MSQLKMNQKTIHFVTSTGAYHKNNYKLNLSAVAFFINGNKFSISQKSGGASCQIDSILLALTIIEELHAVINTHNFVIKNKSSTTIWRIYNLQKPLDKNKVKDKVKLKFQQVRHLLKCLALKGLTIDIVYDHHNKTAKLLNKDHCNIFYKSFIKS